MSNERPKFIWAEKYAPQTIEECILPERIRKIFLGYLEQGSIPNLFLSGLPGTGKTTVAKCLIQQLEMSALVINGSKDGGIDTLRGVIEDFASTKGLDAKKKVVLIDEADYLNSQSTQPALRGFIDMFQNNCRFIFTCNFEKKVLDAITSRCNVIKFDIDPKEKQELLRQAVVRFGKILKEENVPFDSKALAQLVINTYPDMRRTLNELQRISAAHGSLTADVVPSSQVSDVDILFALMKEKKYGDVYHWVMTSDIDSIGVYGILMDVVFKKLEPESVPGAVVYLAKYQDMVSRVANHQLNLLGCLTEIMFDSEFK